MNCFSIIGLAARIFSYGHSARITAMSSGELGADDLGRGADSAPVNSGPPADAADVTEDPTTTVRCVTDMTSVCASFTMFSF